MEKKSKVEQDFIAHRGAAREGWCRCWVWVCLWGTEKHQVTHATAGPPLSKLNTLVSRFDFLTGWVHKVGYLTSTLGNRRALENILLLLIGRIWEKLLFMNGNRKKCGPYFQSQNLRYNSMKNMSEFAETMEEDQHWGRTGKSWACGNPSS